MVEITRLPEDRWQECRNLRLEALKADPLAFGSSYEEEKELSEKEWRKRINNALFALKDGKLVGMIVFISQSGVKTAHVANIYSVFVKRSHRTRGIGSQLIERAVEILKSSDKVRIVRLTVNAAQKEAITLYKKYGFRQCGVLSEELYFEGNYYDEVTLELFLYGRKEEE